jgi:hypothetical protein
VKRLKAINARLVAKGFEKVKGIDYEDTFDPPTVKWTTISIVVCIATKRGYLFRHLDIKTTF